MDFLSEKHNGEAGMTLIEVVAVIVLITLIAVTVGSKVFTNTAKAQAKLNVTKMNSLKSSLAQYKLEYNTYPGKLDDLVHPSSDVKNTGEPFTPFAKDEELKDVWGSPYQYSAENNGRSYVIKSLGEDGVAGGEGAAADVELRP